MAITGWEARSVGTDVIRRSTERGAGLDNPEVSDAVVYLDGGALRLKCDPAKGESIRVFTRRALSANNRGQPTGEPMDVVVLEITPDRERPEKFVRLYLGTEAVLSTEK